MLNPKKRMRFKKEGSQRSFKIQKAGSFYIPRQRFKSTVGRSETKYFDRTLAPTTIGATGNIITQAVFSPALGTDEDQRVGNKVHVKKMFFQFGAAIPQTSSGTTASDSIRVIIYLDTQTNNASANVAQLLTDPNNYLSLRNLSFSKRFHVFYDEFIELDSTGVGAYYDPGVPAPGVFTGAKLKFWKVRVPINLDFTFSANTGSIADLSENNVGMCVITSQGLIQLEYYARTYYTDH